MKKALDHIHHVAIPVNDIVQSVSWYTSNFACEIAHCDESWALLIFDKFSVALVLPNQNRPHFAVTREDVTVFGKPIPHRDGTSSVYVQDPSGNSVEMLKQAI